MYERAFSPGDLNVIESQQWRQDQERRDWRKQLDEAEAQVAATLMEGSQTSSLDNMII